jgi:hypothetical protein
VVVDHEQSPSCAAEFSQPHRQIQEGPARQRLVPELDGVDAAPDPGLYELDDRGRLGFRRDGI